MKSYLNVIVLAIFTVLTGCVGNAPMPDQDGLGLRVSLGAGRARVNGEELSTEQKGRGTGNAYALRVEIHEQVGEDFPNITAGLRGQIGMQDVTADGFGEDGSGVLDVEAESYELHGVLRGYAPVTSWLRPFAEIHGGFGYYTGDLRATGGGLNEPVLANDNDFTGVGGAGLGVELDFAEGASMFFQADYSIRLTELEGIDLRSENLMFFAGGEFRF